MNETLESAWRLYSAKFEELNELRTYWRCAVVDGPPPDVVKQMSELWWEASELLVSYFWLYDQDQQMRFGINHPTLIHV